jgi:hypothetical protein
MATAAQLGKGGIGTNGRGSVSVFHTGGAAPTTTTTGTDTTPVVTETYVCRVFIPANTEITGAALLNGSAVAGNVTAILYDHNGAPVAQSASTAQAGIATLQSIPFAAAYKAQGPGLYFLGFQFNNVAARFRTHILGAFTAFKKTGEVYGTATVVTSPNSFSTGQGPIGSTY